MVALLDEPAASKTSTRSAPLGGGQAVGDAHDGAALRRGGRGRRRGPARSRGRRRSWPRRAPAGPGRRAGPGPSATSWRSPTDRFAAPLADLGVEPVGQAVDPPAEAEGVEGGVDLVVAARRPGRPRRTLSAIVSSNRKPSWGTMRMCRGAGHRRPTVVRSTPPMRISPSVGSARRHSSLANVVLPEPVSPTTATFVPAGMCDVDVVQHRVAAAVGEATCRRPRPPSGPVGQRRRRGSGSTTSIGHVEHAEHLAPAGDGGLGLVEDLAQLRDRPQQQVDEEQERDELADVEAQPCRRPRRRRRRPPAMAMAPKMSPSGNMRAKYRPARSWARYWPVDGACAAGVRVRSSQPVGPDDGGAGDGLGDLGDRVPTRGRAPRRRPRAGGAGARGSGAAAARTRRQHEHGSCQE